MNDNQRTEVMEARRYLETGGLGEVIGFTDHALRNGNPKVQSDTDMAMALCLMASEAQVWRPIASVPRGINVDVWMQEVEGGGWRWADVMVEGEMPYVIIDRDHKPFHPDENGLGVTHWMPTPKGPPSTDRGE